VCLDCWAAVGTASETMARAKSPAEKMRVMNSPAH
jgi:hypothetical protein